MFVRKKQNKTGSVSVRVIDKTSGKHKVKKTNGNTDKLDETDVIFERTIQNGGI
jgi:hypothetical protein